MKVWRYQDDRGYGPYTSMGINSVECGLISDERRDLHGDLNYAHCDCKAHPGAWDDFKYGDCKWSVFGFPSREAADAWFRGFHERLKECGFSLVCIEVPDNKVIWGKSRLQICFPLEYVLDYLL